MALAKLNLDPCISPLWARGGHAQTIFGHLLPTPKLNHLGRRFEVGLPDGDRVVGYVSEGTTSTIVYLFHGLAGSIDSPYMHRTSALVQRHGHSVILMNHRGCGEGAGLARGPYHSGRGEDLGEVIAAGRALYPRHRHIAIGFSMSANALLLLLAGVRGTCLPDAAIAVNGPIELEKCSRELGRGLNRVYDLRFYRQCRRDVYGGLGHDRSHYDIPVWSNLRHFDNLFTAPAGGFRDREEYYSICSTARHLKQIVTPTVLLTASDDPFVPVESYLNSELGPGVTLHIEATGGHMGYLTKMMTPLKSRRWLDYALDQYLRAL